MQGMVKMAVCAVSWLLLFMVHPAMLQFIDEDVLEAPQNLTVGVGDPPLELICRMRRENVYMEINGQIVTLGGADEFLRERGFMFMGQVHNLTLGFATQRVVMELTEGNNNTKVVCIGADDNSSRSRVNIVTPDVFITIIGAPSTPSLQYLVINDETLEVSWDEPHTPVNHSVTSYYIMVTDTYQLPIQLLYEQLDPDIRSINVTQEDPNSCSNLTMQVWAENSLGNGSIGETYGAFPAGPRDFEGSVNIQVSLSEDFSPIVNINFMFPVLCPYNNATYVIEITDPGQIPVHTIGPGLHHWMDSDPSFNMEYIELELDTEYTLNITVWNSAGRVSNVSTFKTPSSVGEDKKSDLVLIVALSCIGGAVVVFLIMIALIMGITYITSRTRKRRRDVFNATEYNGSTHNGRAYTNNLDSRGMPMVDNPIYEKDPIYEEINLSEDGYTSIANTNVEKCTLQDRGNDEYTKMNPVGTLHGQLAVSDQGAAAGAAEAVGEGLCIANIDDGEGASATVQCTGQHQTQDPEGRYIIVN